MSIERRMQALLDLVETDRRERLAAIARDAESAAAALLREAHHEARSRVRAAFADERRLRDERVHAARANLQTKRRLASQHHASIWLMEAWRALPDGLLARWRSAESRRQWIAHVIAQARTALPGHQWSVHHAPDWPDAEREALGLQLRDSGVTSTFHPDAAIRGGLRISGSGTVVDGTLDELTRDRAANAGRLLAWREAEGFPE